jgi:hypothetical protein
VTVPKQSKQWVSKIVKKKQQIFFLLIFIIIIIIFCRKWWLHIPILSRQQFHVLMVTVTINYANGKFSTAKRILVDCWIWNWITNNKYSFVRCSKLKYLKAKNYLFHVIDCPFLEIILGKDFQWHLRFHEEKISRLY